MADKKGFELIKLEGESVNPGDDWETFMDNSVWREGGAPHPNLKLVHVGIILGTTIIEQDPEFKIRAYHMEPFGFALKPPMTIEERDVLFDGVSMAYGVHLIKQETGLN